MKYVMSLILTAMLLLGTCAGALGQEMVSVAELYEQVQAMGGVWRQTFDTPNGEMTVDAPIIVPDVDAMPVITVERAKISEELFEQIRQGKKGGSADEHQYEVELDGKLMEFFLGRDNDYENGERTNRYGYDAANTLWIQHGDYRFSQGEGLMKRAEPSSYLYSGQLQPDQPCLRNSDLTLAGAMQLWKEDIDMCFPDDEFVIQPSTIIVRGSTLRDKTEEEKEYKRDGYFKITAEQVIDGVPLIGGIVEASGGSRFSFKHDATPAANRAAEKLSKFGKGVSSAIDYPMESRFSNEESYRTINSLVRKRTVEMIDVPLAPLDDVLNEIRKEIEKGNIRELYTVRLGYILYSNPDMTDHAWAIPRWTVGALYVTAGEAKNWKKMEEQDAKHGYDDAPWEKYYYQKYLIDAQSAEMIEFTIGNEEIYSVPQMMGWDDVK